MTGNEKLCKIYFKKLFFSFFDLFYSYHYIRYFIYSDCMMSCVYNMYRSCDRRCSFKKVFLKILLIWQEILANFTNLCWCFPEKLAKFLRTPNFEEHLRTPADQMICNKILLEKIWVVFRISIKFDLNRERPAGKRYDFSCPYIRLAASPHRPSSTKDSSTAKEQKLTKQCFLPHRFHTQSSQYHYWKAHKYPS